MRLRDIREPKTGADVTKPTERQSLALRCHDGTITPLRIRHVDDDGRDEEETPDHAFDGRRGKITQTKRNLENVSVDVRGVCGCKTCFWFSLRLSSPTAKPMTPNPQDVSEHGDSSPDADSNPFDNVPCQTTN